MTIEISKEKIRIQDVEISDPSVIAEFLQAQAEGVVVKDLLLKMIALGAQVVALGSHSASVEKLDVSIGNAKTAIQEAADDVSTTLKKQLSDLADEDGSLVRNVSQVVSDLRANLESLTAGEDSPIRKAMLKSLDEAQSKIQTDISRQVEQQRKELAEMLDSEQATSPLRVLSLKLDTLTTSLEELRREQSEAVAIAEVVEAGVIGGVEYEDLVLTRIQRLANLAGDVCEKTGNVTGRVSKSKKGDGVVHLMVGGVDQARIVVEAKNKALSRLEWERESKGAKDNRAAGSFLGLCKHVTDMPSAGRIMVMSPTDIVIAFDPDVDDMELLALTYQLLKLNAIRGFGSLDDISVVEVKLSLEEAMSELEKFDAVNKQVSAIRNSADKIQEVANGIRDTIQQSLRRAEASIRPADEPSLEPVDEQPSLMSGEGSDDEE